MPMVIVAFCEIKRRVTHAKSLQPSDSDQKIQHNISKIETELKAAHMDLINLKISYADEVVSMEEKIKKCRDLTELREDIDEQMKKSETTKTGKTSGFCLPDYRWVHKYVDVLTGKDSKYNQKRK